jgi:hypothetical protein
MEAGVRQSLGASTLRVIRRTVQRTRRESMCRMITDDQASRLTLGSGDAAGTGSWSPRSRNLIAELPDLLRALWSAGHDIHRVVYNPTVWSTAVRAMAVSGRYVKLDGRHTQDPQTVVLIDNSGWNRLILKVTPLVTTLATQPPTD